MEKIEQQIIQLANEIQEVSSQIKTVDCILEKDFNDWSQQEKRMYGMEEEEARKQLRRKEEQLRSEKEQLRELVIEKERQRTQGMFMKE